MHCSFITIFRVLLCILYAYCITYRHKDIVRTCVLSFYVLAFHLCYFRKYYKGFVFSYGAFLLSKKRWILEYSEVFRGYESR
nr:MAG TPA: hypothetical protein [Caudoviricetes sp.]